MNHYSDNDRVCVCECLCFSAYFWCGLQLVIAFYCHHMRWMTMAYINNNHNHMDPISITPCRAVEFNFHFYFFKMNEVICKIIIIFTPHLPLMIFYFWCLCVCVCPLRPLPQSFNVSLFLLSLYRQHQLRYQ